MFPQSYDSRVSSGLSLSPAAQADTQLAELMVLAYFTGFSWGQMNHAGWGISGNRRVRNPKNILRNTSNQPLSEARIDD